MISSKLSPNNFLFATNRPMTSVGTTLCPQHIRPRMRALRGLAEKRKLLRRLNLPSTGMSDAAPLTGTAGRVPAEDDDDAPHEQHHEHTSAERAQGALYLMLGTSLMLVSSVDGVDLRPAKDPAVGKATIDYILAMHAALMGFSGTTEAELLSDENPQKPFWHPKMMWFGPGGIGACRGMDGFVRHHQMPFRTGFPKRAYGNQLRALGHGEGHYVRIGDGNFAGTGGWPSVVESRLFTPPHVTRPLTRLFHRSLTGPEEKTRHACFTFS